MAVQSKRGVRGERRGEEQRDGGQMGGRVRLGVQIRKPLGVGRSQP